MDLDLTPEEQKVWDDFVRHFRSETLKGMSQSALTIMIAPPPDEEFNVQYACEIGAAVLLEKPLLVLCPPGTQPPPKLAAIADRIVYADVDTADGQDRIREAVAALVPEAE